MENIDFELRGEVITLDRLLKAVGVSFSGGAAKQLIADGRVQVDGRDELRKTAQLRAGQVVAVHGTRIRLRAAAPTELPADAPTGPSTDVPSDLSTEPPTSPPL